MDSIVDPKDFPASFKCTYLNTANVALMYQGAEKAIIEWQKDLGENGSINFDETAEATVFRDLSARGHCSRLQRNRTYQFIGLGGRP